MEFGTGSRTILKNEMKLNFDARSENEAFARSEERRVGKECG